MQQTYADQYAGAALAIQQNYAEQAAALQQQLISSGLGNSTILSSELAGLQADEHKALAYAQATYAADAANQVVTVQQYYVRLGLPLSAL